MITRWLKSGDCPMALLMLDTSRIVCIMLAVQKKKKKKELHIESSAGIEEKDELTLGVGWAAGSRGETCPKKRNLKKT